MISLEGFCASNCPVKFHKILRGFEESYSKFKKVLKWRRMERKFNMKILIKDYTFS